MIEQLRADIVELNENIQEWQGEIEYYEEKIEDARVQISDKEAEIERLESEAQRVTLIEQLTSTLTEMSVEQLASIVSSIQNGETPTVQSVVEEHPTVIADTVTDTLQEIESADVTSDMLTDAMHNAEITLVGVKYQDLWRIHHQIPAIGDRITLAKRDGVSSQNTVGYTVDGISIGILPASDDKFAQLERIGANSVNNRDVGLDHSIFDTEYEVVGVICGAFIFLDPIYDEEESIEETVTEAVAQIESARRRLQSTAQTIDEARHIFNEEMPDHCRIDNVIEDNDVYIINYQNHRANTTAEYYQTCEVERV